MVVRKLYRQRDDATVDFGYVSQAPVFGRQQESVAGHNLRFGAGPFETRNAIFGP